MTNAISKKSPIRSNCNTSEKKSGSRKNKKSCYRSKTKSKPTSKKKLFHLRHYRYRHYGYSSKHRPPKRYYGRKYYGPHYSPLFKHKSLTKDSKGSKNKTKK